MGNKDNIPSTDQRYDIRDSASINGLAVQLLTTEIERINGMSMTLPITYCEINFYLQQELPKWLNIIVIFLHTILRNLK